MSDKQTYENWIKDTKTQLERADKLQLGMLLKACSYTTLIGKISRKTYYRLNEFSFSVHVHDTGNGVGVYLHHPDGDKLKIIDRTYWYNESQYGHNKYTYLRGCWDVSLNKTIEQIREGYKQFLLSKIEKYEKDLADLISKQQSVFDKFSSMYSN